jgi:hypothetical protein
VATYHGNDGSATLDAGAVAEVTGFSHNNTADLAEDSACGDEFKTYKPGKKDGSGKIDCHWDPTDAAGQAAVAVGDSVALVLFPSGATSGDGSLTGTVLIEGITSDMTQDGIVSASISYRGYLVPALVA